MSDDPAVVVGVGPGLGSSVARRFAREDLPVALMARGEEKLRDVREDIEEQGGTAGVFPCDATDPQAVAKAFGEVRDAWGDPGVLVYNAGDGELGGILDLDPETFTRCWKVNCLGALLCLQEVLPAMVDRGEGTVILTGATASLRGSAGFANLAVGKNGLRALAQSTAREFASKGVHVSHVVVDGVIDMSRTREILPDAEDEEFLNPDAIADTYWQLHRQDRSAWTLELDLRPHVEAF